MNLWEMIKIIDGHNGEKLGLAEKGRYNWRVMMVAGMWFQDLFNYDFRRTEMCIIPYATQVGEVSFCAYNTGVGWRQIVEKMFSTHSTAQWFKEKGRHPIYAAGKNVPLAPSPAAAPVAVAPPTLDLASLETRLRATRAIGVFTKLSLKNQVSDLFDQFKTFHHGGAPPLTMLRQEYDLLLLKVQSLLQDNDASLASAVSASRESIWGMLADPAKFAKLG